MSTERASGTLVRVVAQDLDATDERGGAHEDQEPHGQSEHHRAHRVSVRNTRSLSPACHPGTSATSVTTAIQVPSAYS